MLKKTYSLRINYDGQLAQIDANTFSTTLINFCSIINEVNNKLFSSDNYKINITAFKSGSFIVDLNLAFNIVNALWNNIQNIEATISAVAILLEFKKFLGGKKPQSINENGKQIIIQDNHGKIFNIDKVYYNVYSKNPLINESIEKVFTTLTEDTAIENYEIINPDNNEKIFSATKDDFVKLSAPNELLLDNEKTIVKEHQTVSILKLVFVKGRKWEFVYDGRKISGIISDDSFFKRLDEGESFAKGDKLLVDIEIVQIYNDEAKVFMDKSYRIIRVINHGNYNSQNLF